MATKPDHTPGPWIVEPAQRRENLCERLATVRGSDRAVVGYVVNDHWRPAKANARLIEAAPDLLAACHDGLFIARAYAAMCREHAGGLPDGLYVSIDAMQAAIRKAEGNES